MTPEQIEAALEGFKGVGCEVTALEWFKTHAGNINAKENPVIFALRLAIKVMGEPSKGMIDAAGTHFENPNPTVGLRCAFKAMRDQLIKRGVKITPNQPHASSVIKAIEACMVTGLIPTFIPKPYKKALKSKALKKRRAKAKAARTARRRSR